MGWLIGMLLIGCMSASRPLPAQEEGVSIRLPYGKAFEKVIEILETRGYTIALADKRTGIIETVPKRVKGEEGVIHHKALLSLLLRGDQKETIVYMRLIISSDDPSERAKILEAIKELSP